MSKLNITKSEVWVKNSRVQGQKAFSVGCGGWEICTTYTDFEEDKANAELIADAFNTANKTDMLPSELLELLRGVKHILDSKPNKDDSMLQTMRKIHELFINEK